MPVGLHRRLLRRQGAKWRSRADPTRASPETVLGYISSPAAGLSTQVRPAVGLPGGAARGPGPGSPLGAMAASCRGRKARACPARSLGEAVPRPEAGAEPPRPRWAGQRPAAASLSARCSHYVSGVAAWPGSVSDRPATPARRGANPSPESCCGGGCGPPRGRLPFGGARSSRSRVRARTAAPAQTARPRGVHGSPRGGSMRQVPRLVGAERAGAEAVLRVRVHVWARGWRAV
jgi:hypothetical protein